MSKQYLFTERTHLMCPNMNFGILASMNAPFDKSKIKDTVAILVKAHPFLSALLGYEEESNRYYYHITTDSQVDLLFEEETVDGIYDEKIIRKYEKLISVDWNLFREGMLKIVCWKRGEKTCLLFVFHHLLADGRAALSLAVEFADYYVSKIEPEKAIEALISSTDDFPLKSKLPLISRILVDNANKRWKKENHFVSYEYYHNFANQFLEKDRVFHHTYGYDSEKMREIKIQCENSQVSVNDYLMAKMFEEESTNKIIMACDLRNQLSCYVHKALGNYSTAFSVELRRKHTDTMMMAREVHTLIQKKLKNPASLYLVLQCFARLDPSLLDAAAISAAGFFNSKAGKFIGTAFFGLNHPSEYSITNLGKIESKSIENALFIPPASPAVKKIKGVLTVNGQMNICTSER